MKKTTKAFFMAFLTYLLLEEPRLCTTVFESVIKVMQKEGKKLDDKKMSKVS